MNAAQRTAAGVHAEVARAPVWYHTLEVGEGVVTPGYFDLRPVVDRVPWPDVRGKRCLDIATFDGFYAFELERRGAAEVIATDVAGPEDFDWPAHLRGWGVERLNALSPEHAGGFEIAKELLGSAVERRIVSVYDLDPEELGTFDVVTCGSLLLHLRDPLRALEAIRGVCSGRFLSIEQISLPLTAFHRRRPVAQLDGTSRLMQWSVPNTAGRRRMLEAAGFEIESESERFSIAFGAGHPSHGARVPLRRRALERALGARGGAPHQATLARPR